MNKVKIITDSCADLSGDQLEQYDIDYVKMSTMKDGRESPALLTWTDAEAHELYEDIRSGKRITTAQVSVEEFSKVFTQYLDDGDDLVYIACSSKQFRLCQYRAHYGAEAVDRLSRFAGILY